ncbi:MAG TPA: SDR family oxidoreductase [Bacteroidota bacterium]|nr:SDR family oxidoreductase [Bacteroidota bacterium]
MKNVLVTGGTGFIGSNLAAALVGRGFTVRILRRPSSDLSNVKELDVEHCLGDIREKESLRKAIRGCDTVFHTAAMVSFRREKREEQHDINVGGTANVVDVCLEEGVERLIHTSSIAALGHPVGGGLADETTIFNWQSADNGYKNSKHDAEKEIERAVGKGLQAVMVNPAVVIGPGDIHFNGGKFIRSVVKHQALFTIDGGTNIVYVGDVVNGQILAATKGKTGERYILGGENLTHKEVFQIIARSVGGIVPRIRMPIPVVRLGANILEIVGNIFGVDPLLTPEMISGAGLYNWYSSEKACRELGYTITPFRQAVEITFRWYREHGLL